MILIEKPSGCSRKLEVLTSMVDHILKAYSGDPSLETYRSTLNEGIYNPGDFRSVVEVY